MNKWLNKTNISDDDSERGVEPPLVLHARDLDRRLRGEFDGSSDQGKQEKVQPVTTQLIGTSVVTILRNICAPLSGDKAASAKILEAHYGANPSEANLALLGRELGADLVLKHGSARKLKRAATPFVCVLKDQRSVGVLGKNAAGKWICQTATGKIAVDQKDLIKQASGTWIGVKRLRRDDKPLNREEVSNYEAHPVELLKRFAGLVFKNRRGELVQLWAAAGLSNLILIALPLFITIVYDRVIPHGAFETLAALTIGVVLVFLIDIGLRATRINLLESIGASTGLRLQTLFYRKLLCAPLAKSQKSSSGVSALLSEVDHVALSMPSLFAGLLADLPFVIIMLSLVGYLSGPVVFAPIVGILIIVIINVVGSMRARKAAGRAHELRLKLQDETVATSTMLSTIKGVCAEQELLNRWENRADETAYQMNRARQSAALSAQTALVITQLIVAFTIVIGAIQINAGAMTLGNLAASVLLVGRILSPVSQVVSQVGQLRNMGGALRTFFGVIDQADEKGGDEVGSRHQRFQGAIRFSNVSFSYEGAASQSLSDINLEIKPGERVGLIGRNGCGKSTLLKLIPRFFDPDEGTLLLDGLNSLQMSPQFLRRSIGLMSQDTVLMQDSLRANICLGLSDVDPKMFEQAVRVSGVAALAKDHPEGYSLNVGPRGEALSGGERQQVGLARAFLRDPSVVILDEPTSAMDNTTEGALIAAMPSFIEGRTLILATHRTQMLSLVDRIILMENGRIVADGPKSQVLATLQKAS